MEQNNQMTPLEREFGDREAEFIYYSARKGWREYQEEEKQKKVIPTPSIKKPAEEDYFAQLATTNISQEGEVSRTLESKVSSDELPRPTTDRSVIDYPELPGKPTPVYIDPKSLNDAAGLSVYHFAMLPPRQKNLPHETIQTRNLASKIRGVVVGSLLLASAGISAYPVVSSQEMEWAYTPLYISIGTLAVMGGAIIKFSLNPRK